ncbi:hypothetical protein LVD15_20360 [Fulvivirga maritima]|uniref:hypothetical protein n=1 Tax=Fulvivirga maritima TaxID=2904247 RepID=UPI001F379A67|nr:hypothetical protein [Fulvivirga maritima]UII25636.1 hypothetical protein LVD15_20360 [Fulvivirga maritima]
MKRFLITTLKWCLIIAVIPTLALYFTEGLSLKGAGLLYGGIFIVLFVLMILLQLFFFIVNYFRKSE